MSNTLIKKRLIDLNPNQIIKNRFQPRKCFRKETLEELKESIRSIGLLQPLVVRYLAKTDVYELIAGERRLKACLALGWKTIPVIVYELGEEAHYAQAALIENIQRQELNPLEIAQSIRLLIDSFCLSQIEVAKHIGKKRSTVANYLRILKLDKKIQSNLEKGSLSMAHAKLLLSIADTSMQLLVHEKILNEQLTVQQTQTMLHEIAKKERETTSSDCMQQQVIVKDLSEQLEAQLGTKVEICHQGNKGRLIIHYFDWDQLDGVIEHLMKKS